MGTMTSAFVSNVAQWNFGNLNPDVMTNVPKMSVSTLSEFATEKGLYFDEGRQEFINRHEILIEELVTGKLRGRNRYRELLLGVKSVGKSAILDILRKFVKIKHPSIFIVSASFDGCDCNLTCLIIKVILAHLGRSSDTELADIRNISDKQVAERIAALERFSQRNDLYLLLLLDAFHFVYSKPADIGCVIVKELSVLVGSATGRNHCIVSGSSNVLRALAFAKLPPEQVNSYPSYRDRIDLNSTKLQPRWIYPLSSAADFRAFCKLKELKELMLDRYIYSGGRPGLALENPNLNDISDSCTSKLVTMDSSNFTRVLHALVDSMHSFSGC